jgi:DNA-binding NarL/FixJ family response regulator
LKTGVARIERMVATRDKDMIEEPIRIVIVDDHAGVRAGIKSFFDNEEDIVVVGEGATGVEALQLTETQNPDVLLLDVEMPVLAGEEVVKRLQLQEYEGQVLAVSSHDELYYIRGMLENGAAGYITKDEVPKLLLSAIRSLAAGSAQTWLSPRVKKRLGVA